MTDTSRTPPVAPGNSAPARKGKPTAAAIAKARADVKAGRKRPSEAAMELVAKTEAVSVGRQLATEGGADFAVAERDAVTQTRRGLIGKVREAKRKMDGAKTRAATATQQFERAVVLLASEKPSREDWYEYPGPVARKDLMDAAGLSTVALHRIMERYRKANPPRRARGRKR